MRAPAELREQFQKLTKMALLRRCAALRPGPVIGPGGGEAHAEINRPPVPEPDKEITAHEQILTDLVTKTAPQLVAAFGIGPDVAAKMLIVVGDNLDRVRSEVAFATLCGVSPIPTSSGLTTRNRLSRGAHRHANSALYPTVIVRMQPRAHQGLRLSTTHPRQDQSRDHPVPEATPCTTNLDPCAPPSRATQNPRSRRLITIGASTA